ncbi:hypothetical protein AVEN_37758-1 [Araneus ventricosus]|uniref:Uncharacterized protein n=1 Tax=Araneus ventricosus TaxID=182803 RepID=A0A4Y2BSX1_ARAVE|nr:hypothetical protein AVEN_37758-1 [Araneus ventricosus]
MGVWWKQSNKQDNAERRFIQKYPGKQGAQVTIGLVQISSVNRQQFISNNSNSTFNRVQLTGYPASTADETPKPSLLSVASVYIPLLDMS